MILFLLLFIFHFCFINLESGKGKILEGKSFQKIQRQIISIKTNVLLTTKEKLKHDYVFFNANINKHKHIISLVLQVMHSFR